MADHEVFRDSTTEGIPLAPSLGPEVRSLDVEGSRPRLPPRVVFVAAAAVVVGAAAAGVAHVLVLLIDVVTNAAFFGRLSAAPASPSTNALGWGVVFVPVIGGLVVGWMARHGSSAIRGHGIPEAMEQVLTNDSRVPARVAVLKPLSAAVAIGTGGPFGAEGPIIATGGALGSLLGQTLRITAEERKTLLAAGAAAGMAAIFGTPVAAVLLAVELLLFEYRRRSLLPVAFAASTACALRIWMFGSGAAFAVAPIVAPSPTAVPVYALVGAVLGAAAVAVTWAVYAVEDAFARLPVHWAWWPAIGAVVVGVVGFVEPRTLGVGYRNVEDAVSGGLVGGALATLCALKFVSWTVSLGSGTSGGTLAPLLTIGGALGALLGAGAKALVPAAGVDPRMAALVGMAALFCGASRAFLASVVFAFEATHQTSGVLPLLVGCAAAFLVSSLLMPNTIMTEKIARRGRRVPSDYGADDLSHLPVADAVVRPVRTLEADRAVHDVRRWLDSGGEGSAHQGFPVIDRDGALVGVVTRRDLLRPAADPGATVGSLVARPPVVAFEDETLRQAADRMVLHAIGRLPVVRRVAPGAVVGILTRSDVLAAHSERLESETHHERVLALPRLFRAWRSR